MAALHASVFLALVAVLGSEGLLGASAQLANYRHSTPLRAGRRPLVPRRFSPQSRVRAMSRRTGDINPPFRCGQPLSYSVDGYSHDGEDREVAVYTPAALCGDGGAAEGAPAPIVVGLHCFGCEPDYYVGKLVSLADELGFTLVVPAGVERSWNAGPCCGTAMELQLDDVGFVHAALAKAQEVIDKLSSTAVFVTGWSNGGYLASLLGMQPDSPFKAIAPISGYQYTGYNSINHSMPLFQHHGRHDPLVSFGGCCNNKVSHGSGRCCCGIDEHSGNECVDVEAGFDQWASHVNACGQDEVLSYTEHATHGIHCKTRQGCAADSTLCVYDHGGHFNMGTSPLNREIALFFMRHACAGVWDAKEASCHCDGSGTGQYCLS